MIGRILGGRYEIIEDVDSGGMALIFKALCKKTKNVVAVKVLKEEFANKAEYVMRFKKEAQAVFSLEHDNIVRVRDIGCDEGVYYMVMDYIDGVCLKSLIGKQPIEEKDAIVYAAQVCSALSAAHKKGIIHRDIKPHNIMLDKNNNIKLMDFGIAKSMGMSTEKENQVIGSVYYVSPEQARGEEVDARSDIYSLGIVLYEMITGELPFTGDKTASVALKHLNEQITAPIEKNPNISAAINGIVLKATSKSPKDRYRTVGALKQDLMRALIDKEGTFLGQRRNQTPQKQANHKIVKICILAALVFLLVGLAVIGVKIFTPEEQYALPDLIDKEAAYALPLLESLGYKVELSEEPSEVTEQGFVIKQSPEPGNNAASGSVVALVVSSGPADLVMPDLFGFALNEAVEIIEDMGLVLGDIIYEQRDDMPEHNIISQSLFADTIVEKGEVITLIVSGSQQTEDIVMPKLTGLNVLQAVKMLNELGFGSYLVYEEESTQPEGIVTNQSPRQGAQESPLNRVDIWISSFSGKRYNALLQAQLKIAEPGTIIRAVIETPMEGASINIAQEQTTEGTGLQTVTLNLTSIFEGAGTVKVYVNNELVTTQEVRFVGSE